MCVNKSQPIVPNTFLNVPRSTDFQNFDFKGFKSVKINRYVLFVYLYLYLYSYNNNSSQPITGNTVAIVTTDRLS